MWTNRIERVGVFETNSSSSHNITISKGALTDTILDRDGKIYVQTGNFNYDNEIISGAAHKASYALTQLKNNGSRYNDYGEEVSGQQQSDSFELMLRDVLLKHTKATEIIFEGCENENNPEGRWGSVSSTALEMFESEETLEQFIFNSACNVEISYDG